MSEALNLNSDGSYKGYPDLMDFFKRKAKETPKGVSLKLERNKHILLQFVFPDTGKRSSKACNVQFTEKGILEALDKAWKVKEALDRFETASEFWNWYNSEILNKNNIRNDLKTYREIFEEIEEEYWQGTHRGTGEKRSKNIPSFHDSFKRCYSDYFNKFKNWDKYPEWEDMKEVLFSFSKGTKSFEECHSRLKKIAFKCPKQLAQSLIEKLESINPKQTEFREKQSIDLDTFLNWFQSCFNEIPSLKNEYERNARESYLWVCAMSVVYGLRASEICSAINLFKPVTESEIKKAWGNKGKQISGSSNLVIPAINDPNNKELLLVLGHYYYVGDYYIGEKQKIPISIKTGGRIIAPLCTDKKIIELLTIQYPKLPKYCPESDSKLESIPTGFIRNYRKKLISWNCPVTQTHAFRHLSNQLGERYGIPQEIRARSLGHSTAMNDTVYKSRSNIKTTVDLLTNYSKQPLGLDAAISQLTSVGIDIEDLSVKAVLRVVYQLDKL